MLEHLDDVEADLSAFHNIGEQYGKTMYDLSGPYFFKLVNRLWYFKGVMRGLAEMESNRQSSGSAAATQSRSHSELREDSALFNQLFDKQVG